MDDDEVVAEARRQGALHLAHGAVPEAHLCARGNGSQQPVVELSPDVAAAAQCFGTTSSSGLDIVTGDGRAYLENSAENVQKM